MFTKKRDYSQRASSRRYNGSPDSRSSSPPYISRYSTGSQNTTADRKRRLSSSHSRFNYSLENRQSSSRLESNCRSRSDKGIAATAPGRTRFLCKPRLLATLSENCCTKDRFYDDEEGYRKENRHLKENDDSSEDDDAFFQEISDPSRDEHIEDRGRRNLRRTGRQNLRLRPNLSSRSSNFRMQLYRELNVINSNKAKKKFLHGQCREFGLSDRNRVREEPLSSKVSFSYPGDAYRFERSKPIAMGSGERFEDDDWDYNRKSPEPKNDETLPERSESEDVFALDIGPLS